MKPNPYLVLRLLCLLLLFTAGAAHADAPAQVPNEEDIVSGGGVVGRHYRQTGGGTGLGYDVREPFYSRLQALGGPTVVGYPVSIPFDGTDGCRYQAFQVALLQECPGAGVRLANTFQIMEEAGVDDVLQTKGIRPGEVDAGTSFNESVRIRLEWLEDVPLRMRYLSQCGAGDVAAAVQFCGLPMNHPANVGPFVSQRFQRIAFQRWLVEGPGGIRAGDVTPSLGGDLMKETGVLSGLAVQPHPIAQVPPPPVVSFVRPQVAPPGPPVPPQVTPPVPPRPTVVGGLPASLQLDFFDATALHPDARGFQLAAFDAKRRQVVFFPWGPADQPLGVLLFYRIDGDFRDPASYRAIDLTKLVDPAALGFGAGFIDDTGDWLYLPALRKRDGTRIVRNGLTVRVDLRRDPGDPAAYEKFDLATLMPRGLSHIGWAPGIASSGYIYYCPVNDESDNRAPHGMFLRYNPARPFGDAGSWEWFDLGRNINARAVGFQSIEQKPPHVYLVPFGVGYSLMVRYDTTKPLASASSYESFDLLSVHPEAKAFTGAVVAGDTLVLVPWRDLTRPQGQQSMSVALAFDTRRALADRSAWSFIDLTTVNPQARGYQFGWIDTQGVVFFVPTANYSIGRPPPFVAWDSRLPFSDPASWRSYPSTGEPPSTGAAFANGLAYLAPYGSGTSVSGLITRVTPAR